ncbi:MAG TPA: hypothetical protein VHN77_08405 [Phycisphaerales bacterium]|nr:hypothetical protein [Phycisphaerales bacterium]
MRPHPRIRKTIKWGGLTLAVAMMVFAAYTAEKVWIWTKKGATHYTVVIIRNGRAEVNHWPDQASPPLRAGPVEFTSGTVPTKSVNLGLGEWQFGRFIGIIVPFWMPALASLVLSGFAWRLDTLATRRAKLGACPKCSYPRTGLAPSAPCPECGAAAPQA